MNIGAHDISDNDSENLSEVSLDEEDEELIWRVFYADLEKRQRSNNPDAFLSDDEIASSDESVSDISEVDDPELIAKYEELKATVGSKARKRKSSNRPKELNEEEKKRLIISTFTGDQMDRFESYRRTRINKPGVKKICTQALGHSIGQNISVVLAGLSKSFLGEIITRAYDVQENEFKARLSEDIEAKKKHKRNALRDLQTGKEVKVTNIPLKYRGDNPTSLQPEHIREALRLSKLESSGTLSDKWRGQGDNGNNLFK